MARLCRFFSSFWSAVGFAGGFGRVPAPADRIPWRRGRGELRGAAGRPGARAGPAAGDSRRGGGAVRLAGVLKHRDVHPDFAAGDARRVAGAGRGVLQLFDQCLWKEPAGGTS